MNMAEEKNQKLTGSVSKMALKQFADATAKSKPEITGGCVVATIAGLAITLLIMPFEISAKKTKEASHKTLLKEKIGILKKIKKQLTKAADYDLEVFNQYRFNKLPAKNHDPEKLKYKALIYAIKSPLKVASLINESISASINCVQYCQKNLISDIQAGAFMLQASLKSILALANSNIKGLNEHDFVFYKDLSNKLEDDGLKESEALIDLLKKPS